MGFDSTFRSCNQHHNKAPIKGQSNFITAQAPYFSFAANCLLNPQTLTTAMFFFYSFFFYLSF